MRAVDVHGFGGGFTLGAVQAGFDLVGKMSREIGFGVYACLANRQLLGENWDSITGADFRSWEPIKNVDLVMGNPPCSGFSTLSSQTFRDKGAANGINDYMWELVGYAARVAPPIVIWESVQQTFRQGLGLMRQLHDELEKETGHEYTLYHVLHNNASVGGGSNRKRYFWVASRIGFGVDWKRARRQDGKLVAPTAVPDFDDLLRDLEPLGMTMAPQAYRGVTHSTIAEHEFVRVDHSAGWARREVHDGTGMVDGQDVFSSPTLQRIRELAAVEPWGQGERMADVLQRLYLRTGGLTPGWDYLTADKDAQGVAKRDEQGNVQRITKAQRLVDTGFAMGVNQPYRWRGNRPANVITGGACHLVVHPNQDRTLTNREAARIQGFPDDWKIWPVRYAADLGPAWGKGVPVQAGRWIASYAREALAGNPGPDSGVPLEQFDKKLAKKWGTREREYVMDYTYTYKNLRPELR